MPHHASFVAIKTLKTPLPPGVDDERINWRRLRDGVRVGAEILSREPVVVMGMPTENRRLQLRVEDDAGPRTVLLAREFVPALREHARRHGRAGTSGGRSAAADRVTIDWPIAAVAAASA